MNRRTFLLLWPWPWVDPMTLIYLYSTWRFWRCACIPIVNFLGGGFHKLRASQTDRHTGNSIYTAVTSCRPLTYSKQTRDLRFGSTGNTFTAQTSRPSMPQILVSWYNSCCTVQLSLLFCRIMLVARRRCRRQRLGVCHLYVWVTWHTHTAMPTPLCVTCL